MKQNIENKARILGKGTWISLGSPIVTEVISMMQFDWLLFDLEHGFMQEHDILPNLMAVKSSGTKVIVRVSEFRSGLIARLLDWGVAGIMMPHVSSSGGGCNALSAFREKRILEFFPVVWIRGKCSQEYHRVGTTFVYCSD